MGPSGGSGPRNRPWFLLAGGLPLDSLLISDEFPVLEATETHGNKRSQTPCRPPPEWCRELHPGLFPVFLQEVTQGRGGIPQTVPPKSLDTGFSAQRLRQSQRACQCGLGEFLLSGGFQIGQFRGRHWSNYFQTVVLEKTLESLLDSKEIKPVNSKGNQP